MASSRLIGAVLLLACSHPGNAAVRLNAELTPDGSVALRWSEAPDAAGYWLELATPGTDFTKLALLWRGETRYVHERVAPDTTFLYRVRPFRGEPSPVEVAEPEPALADAAGALEEGPLDAPGAAGVKRVAADAAELRWSDTAAEDGYMLELASDDAAEFRLGALLPPDSTSFRKLGLPPSRVRFRVRAFAYGATSNLARVETLAE